MPKAIKFIKKTNEPITSRLKKALEKLEKEPTEGNVIKLQGRGGYRLRVGDYRMIFDKKDNKIIIYDIDNRGGIYK